MEKTDSHVLFRGGQMSLNRLFALYEQLRHIINAARAPYKKMIKHEQEMRSLMSKKKKQKLLA